MFNSHTHHLLSGQQSHQPQGIENPTSHRHVYRLLRVLETTRRGAQGARVSAINQLKALVVTAPVDLRDQLRGLSTAALVAKCSAFRIRPAPINELTATKAAMRSVARRIRSLATEIVELKAPITELVTAVAPYLLDQPGIGPITAAQIYIAWSHPGRCRSEARVRSLSRRGTPRGLLRTKHPPPAKPLR